VAAEPSWEERASCFSYLHLGEMDGVGVDLVSLT
jgi:hypothetical protein